MVPKTVIPYPTVLVTTETQKLNVTGISTFGGNLDINANVDISGHTYMGNTTIAGVTTFVSSGAPAVKIVQSALNINAEMDINATNGGQARLNLRTSKSGTNRAARIDFFNQHSSTTPIWTLISDYDQNATNDFRLVHYDEKAIVAQPDGVVQLYYDGTIKFNTASTGATVHGSADPNLTIRQGSSSSSGSGFLAYENVDGNGNPRSIAKIQGKTTGNGGYGDLIFQTAFNNTLTERLRILSDGTIRGGSQVAAQPSTTVAGFQFDAGGEYLRISKGGGASGTSGAGISLIGGGSNTNHLATTSWGSNIYLINTNQVDNNANALVFANKNSLASSMIVGKNDSHASRNGSLIFATSNGSSPAQRMRITKEGSINIGTDSTQSTHMLYMQGTGSVGIHLRADTDNSGENDNPYISMGQDGAGTQQLKLGMAGDANADFNMQITNSPFLHANNGTSQPLQLAHMSDMAVTISSVSGLGAGGQSATDPRDFDTDGSLAGNAVGGMKIHHYGNDTAAALMLSGHNNTGTPGTETRTQLTHTGANLRFHIEHHGYEAFNIGPTGNIYLKNCSTVPSFTTSYNVSAISLKGGSLMNYQEDNIYLTNNLHYTGSWVNTYAGSGGLLAMGSGALHHYYYANDSSAGNAQSLIRSVSFYKNNSAGTGLNTGNRPSYQGTIIIWGHSGATTAGGIEFHTSGGGGAGYGGKITCNSGGSLQFHCRSNNSAWSTYLTINSSNGQVSGNLVDTSDISLKRNVESISTSCIDNIKKLNPVTFEWKAFGSDEKQIGFIAQEVEKVIPEAVKGEDGEKALNVTGIVAQLTKALQESITKIEILEAKVAALESS